MRLRELEKFKQQYPQLEDLFPKFEDYLLELSAKSDNPDIVPVILAKRLLITEVLATALLGLLDKIGLLEPHYLVWCPKTEFCLKEYSNLKDIPKELECPADNEKHNTDICEIQLVFRFTESFKIKYPPLVKTS